MAASTNLGPDVVSGGGDWLFRQGEMVLGPVPAQQIVSKLYAGELTGLSEISPLGQQRFRPIAQEPFFKVHLAKAEAKLRVEAAANAERSKAQRSRNLKIGVVALVALVVAAGAASAARYLAIHNPFKTEDAYADITMEPPVVGVARARKNDDDLVDYPSGTSTSPSGPKRTEPRGGERKVGDRGPRAASGTASGGPKLSNAADDPDGMQMATFDRTAINSVVSSKKTTLYGCFREETQRHPGFAAKIPIAFVIGNDGRVSKLWVDNPQLKTGPLADCLLRELQKWPFKPYEGEQANVELAFKIGNG